jgi:hypothetical protein
VRYVASCSVIQSESYCRKACSTASAMQVQLFSKRKQSHMMSSEGPEPECQGQSVQVKRPGQPSATFKFKFPPPYFFSHPHHLQKPVEICRVNYLVSRNLLASPVTLTLGIIMLPVGANEMPMTRFVVHVTDLEASPYSNLATSAVMQRVMKGFRMSASCV